jgi:OOP family OmpA-OmpF porin
MSRYFLFNLLSLLALGLFSQNLIMNPGFEKTKCGTWTNSSIENCVNWSSPNLQTPDFFNNQCNDYGTVKIPDLKWWGPQYPHHGKAYNGIIGYRPNGGDIDKIICEYMQGKLKKTLTPDTKYIFEMYVSLAECSMLNLKKIGVFFSEKEINEKSFKPLVFNPSIILNLSQIDTTSWVGVSGEYVAKGGEQYIIIGSFLNDDKVKYSKVKPSKEIKGAREEAYYFIDDVSLIEEGTFNDPPPLDSIPVVIKPKEPGPDTILPEVGVPIVLKNIFFESGKYELLPESNYELTKLYTMLAKNEGAAIIINGYTDNVGKKQDNLLLSKNRAKAVYEFLIAKGISKDRLRFEGYGDSHSVADNTTEEGREKNRRVEFILSKK